MVRKLKNSVHLLLAIIASIFYGFPAKKLKIIAVTGTDGKTTTATLLYKMLQHAHYPVALISTVGAYIENQQIDTGFHVTSPSPFAIQRLLSRAVAQKIEYIVLEVTSHGIDQHRVWGIHPICTTITNVTHEHLDYHKTFENYLATKARLGSVSHHVVLNTHALESFEQLSKILQKEGVECTNMRLDALPKDDRAVIEKRFPNASYNVQNAALALTVAQKLGVDRKDCLYAISHFSGVVGRMQEVNGPAGVRVIVDFAHTPNALRQVLSSLQESRKSGNLIVVFGCAGQRDATKRPLMGQIATTLADFVVLTSEDPRDEDPWSIIAQIKSGVKEHHDKIVSIEDRGEAIAFALHKLSQKKDTIIITGKGHEQSMCIGNREYPWSDVRVVENLTAFQGK